MYEPYGPRPPMYYRPEKDYLGEAFITLLLYFVGMGVAGLIANIIFLNNARRDQNQGVNTRNVGCLQVLLWFQIISLVLACAAVAIIMLLGGFAAVFGGSGY